MSCLLIYSTFPDESLAIEISRVLLSEKLIACANIINNSLSLYHWQDQIKEAREAILIAKTTKIQAEKVIKRIKQLHKYECPCIVAIEIADGNRDYINWIENVI